MRLVALTLVYVLACHHAKPPTSAQCLNNTTLQFKRIDGYRDKYKAGAHDPHAVAEARLYLETARFVLTGKGIDGSGGACTNADHGSADYGQLIATLAAHERDVRWMESERGVHFAGVVNANLTWTWVKTGAPVGQNEANDL
jgi:hypothetical protein